MFANYSIPQDTRTDRERELEEQVDRYRQRDNDAYERREREREQRYAEARELREYEHRTAETWKESLEKQRFLCQRERQYELDDCREFGGNPLAEEISSFAQTLKGCERGLQLWEEIEKVKQPEIDELLAKVEELRNSIRLEVADRLEKEHSSDGWNEVVEKLRSDEHPSDWLQW